MLTMGNLLCLAVSIGLCVWAGDVPIAGWWSGKSGVQRLESRVGGWLPYRRTLALLILGFGVVLRCMFAFSPPGGGSIQEQEIQALGAGLRRGTVSWATAFPGARGEAVGLLLPALSAWLGQSMVVSRLALAIPGCLAMVALWDMLRRHASEQAALWVLALCAIAPWHLLSAGMGEGTVLLAHLLVLASWAFLRERHRMLWLPVGALLLGLSMYTCDLAWTMVPIFLLAALGLLLWCRRARVWQALCMLLVFLLVAYPALATWAVNAFDLPAGKAYGLQVAKMEPWAHAQEGVWRTNDAPFYEAEAREATLPIRQLVYGRVVHTLYDALKYSLFQLPPGEGEAPLPYPDSAGWLYLFSLPFTLLGGLWVVVRMFGEKQKTAPDRRLMVGLFAAMMLSALPTFALHRWLPASHYAVWFYPMLLLTALGILYVRRRVELSWIPIVAMYGGSFLWLLGTVLSR